MIRIAIYQEQGLRRNRSGWSAFMLGNRDPRIREVYDQPRGQAIFKLVNNIVQFYGQPPPYTIAQESVLEKNWTEFRAYAIRVEGLFSIQEPEHFEVLFESAPVRSYYELRAEVPKGPFSPGVPLRSFEPEPFYAFLMED